MIRHCSRWIATAAVVLGVVVPSLAVAQADSLACKRTIAKASSTYVRARTKALARCEDGRIKGRIRIGDPCAADPATMRSLESAWVKLFADINRSCGGANRDCGDGDDLPLGSTGWGSVSACPDFESTGCSNAISSCTDISACLQCIGARSVDQGVATYAANFATDQFATSTVVNRCQLAINKGASKYIQTRAKVLQKCWDASLRGAHANPCPDPGDGRALDLLAKAEARKLDTICRSCGGPDKSCNGVGDLTPAAIGFAPTCPAVAPVGGPTCAGPVSTLSDLVGCIDCVADFKTDCPDAAAVPELVNPYPATCNPSPTTTVTTSSSTTTTTSSTTTTTTSSSTTTTTTTTTSSTTTSSSTSTTTSTTGPTTTTESTTTTTASTTTTTIGSAPTILDFTNGAAGGTCGNTRNAGGTIIKNLTCGGLNIGGGPSIIAEGPTPAGSVSRFALSCTGSSCTVSATTTVPAVNSATPDCTTTACNFGTPLPIPNPSLPPLSTCIVNKWGSPGSGTLDIGTGVASLNIPLSSDVYITGAALCPKCLVGGVAGPGTGTCGTGARAGQACTSTNPNGLTRDCPPLASQYIGAIPVNLSPATTGTRQSASATGQFCTGQSTAAAGCFGSALCRTITETGIPAGALALSTPQTVTLASTFCIPSTGNGAVDGSASLPGPGAVSLPGTFRVSN